ncbi:MAG: hypothetical protein IMZ46_15600 [Acidobacteria bacterium]|nr:hypothetical protein [Acidobacteriota bacterium]
MHMNQIHDYARRLFDAHGDKAEVEAARKATECDQQGSKHEARDWRRIQSAIAQMRGPHVS